MKHLFLSTLVSAILFSNVASAASYKEILSDGEKYRTARLTYNSLHDYLLVPVQVNGGKAQYFLLDTGITSTRFTLKGAQATGLKMVASASTTSGVGGSSKSYSLSVDSIVIGGISRFNNVKIGVTNIPAIEKANNYGGVQVAGVLGSDFLSSLNAIVDFGSASLFVPKTKDNTGLSSALNEADFVKSPFVDFGQYRVPVLKTQAAGKSCLMVYDTGAKATLLTEAFVKQNSKIKTFETATKVAGVAGNTASRQAYVDSIKFAGVVAKANGVIVGNMSHLQKSGRTKWSGIIGSDLMFPTKTLIDYGSKAIYTTKQEIDASELGKAGLFPGDKDAVMARMAKCEAVATGKMTQLLFDKGAPIKDTQGNSYLKATITFQPMKTFKGSLTEGEKIMVKVIVPNTKTAQRDLLDQALTQPRRILLMPEGAGDRRILFSQTFLRTSAVRDAHLAKLMES